MTWLRPKKKKNSHVIEAHMVTLVIVESRWCVVGVHILCICTKNICLKFYVWIFLNMFEYFVHVWNFSLEIILDFSVDTDYAYIYTSDCLWILKQKIKTF